MNYKGIIRILLFLSVIGTGIGVLAEPGSFGLGCVEGGVFCGNPFVPIPGEPFLAVSIAFFIILIILSFLRREVFMAWAKFAAVGFPIMLAVLLYTYNNEPTSGGFGLAGLISDEMLATAFLPALFFIISTILIIAKKLRSKSKQDL